MDVHRCLNLCLYCSELLDILAIQMVQARPIGRHRTKPRAIKTHKKVPLPNFYSTMLVFACYSPKFGPGIFRSWHNLSFCVTVRLLCLLLTLLPSLHLALRLRYVYRI